MDNYAMMQYFEWYLPADHGHWNRLAGDAEHLAALGISGIWLPPCCKSTGDNDVGYGIYDLYDLGEFDQKGTVPTKYGTRADLLASVEALHVKGLKVYADVVLNHKAAADETQEVTVVEVDRNNRDHQISDPFTISAWTRFTFPGRAGKYSEFTWGWQHFTGTDYDARNGRVALYKIVGENKGFAENVDQENGNYDYLMFADIDYQHPEVTDETIRWGKWLIDTLQLDGMRLDAVKHINQDFIERFIGEMRAHAGQPFFTVAEYWRDDRALLTRFLNEENFCLTLFDVPLHFNLFEAGRAGRDYDLRKVFDDTLVKSNPLNVVTFVDNHDSQPHQALESYVADWFKMPAYALILLRRDGYPCLFYGDYYGIAGDNPRPGRAEELDKLLLARKNYAYGEQIDFFDDPHRIAWIRRGDADHPGSGLVVLISNDEVGGQVLPVGQEFAGTEWEDLTGNQKQHVTIADDGRAYFPVDGGTVSAFAQVRG